MSIPCGRLATVLGEDALFMVALEDTRTDPEDAYETKTFELLQAVEPVPEVMRERPSRMLGTPTTIDVG